nr:PREDICTED: TLD domain-containing protein 1-like [Latimeria chalumnae]|eukprot:XP_006014546.2 PREDICTED: TLD domain-containing protein 1-like [Latimeria chalumnae]
MLNGWNWERTQDNVAGVKLLAETLVSEMTPQGERSTASESMDSSFDESAIEKWVFRIPQISNFLHIIITRGLRVELQRGVAEVLPKCTKANWIEFVSILSLPAIMYLNAHLPSELQQQWQLVFSSCIHGESFSQLCSKIVHKGPSILIVKDNDGHIFGGFASHSWEIKPHFQGKNFTFNNP